MTQPARQSAFDEALAQYYRSALDLAVEIKALRFYLALRRAGDEAKANFNPSQQRVPRGNADGGQWTRTGGGSGRMPQPRLIPARAEQTIRDTAWTASTGPPAICATRKNGSRRGQNRTFPGGLEALARLPDATTEFVFSLGGDAGRRAYADWVDQSGKVSALSAQILRENLDREIARGTITRQQAEDVTVVAMAAAGAGARGRLRTARLGRAIRKNYKKTFFEAHPELRGRVVVHHAVEQKILNKHPGLVDVYEMHSVENLRGIPKSKNSKVHLSAIRREWNAFYRTHPKPKRRELLQKVDEIDAKYGHLFIPPAEQKVNYYLIEPEVAGGWGDMIEVDRSSIRPRVTRLHYEFDDWLGSSILTSTPCYVVTEAARRRIEGSNLTGAMFDDVLVTTSELFDDLNPDGLSLPPFYWLKIHGVAGKDDFGLVRDVDLVISQRALVIFEELGLSDSEITPWPVQAENGH